MRTKLQQLYDRFYYGFERWLVARSEIKNCKKRLSGQTVGREFHDEWRRVIRPYWQRYGARPNKCWAQEIYLITGSADPRYLPMDVYSQRILPYFNDPAFVRPLADKNLNSLMYPGIKRPETVYKYMTGQYCADDFSPITQEEAVARLTQTEHAFLKPSRFSAEGQDIRSLRFPRDTEELPDILRRYAGLDYIVQRAVIQHPALAELNASSVNTLRVITLRFRGEVRILSAILRVGAAGSDIDNIGAGGYQCPVAPDGSLGERAYTHRSGQHAYVDRTADGVIFAGRTVPSFDRVRETVIRLARTTPHLGYIAWDIAIDEEGDPVLIEFNAHVPGQNQATCGPTFGELTDEVLSEVFGK